MLDHRHSLACATANGELSVRRRGARSLESARGSLSGGHVLLNHDKAVGD